MSDARSIPANYAAYREIRAVNWSRLKHLAVSPLAYRHAVLHPPPDSSIFLVGRATHKAVLEPDTFEEHFAVYEGPVRRGRAYEEFAEDHQGEEILIRSEIEAARGCAAAVLAHPVAAPYLAGGLREQVLTWTDPMTGIPCKGRADHVSDRVLELKTARDVAPWRFGADAARLLYHGQIAFYHDGAQASAKVALTDPPVIVAVASQPPHDVAVYVVPEDVLEAGRALYQRLLEQLKACVARGEWPGLCTSPFTLSLPGWAYGSSDESDSDGLDWGA